MKKVIFAMIAAISVAAYADEDPKHGDVAANTDGFYDLTITTRHLSHSEKTVTRNFSTSRKSKAVDQFLAEYEAVKDLAGFEVIQLTGITKIDVPAEELDVKKITFKYKYYDYRLINRRVADVATNRTYVSKLISKASKGVYDSDTGKVYLWDTADKYTIAAEATKESNPDIIAETGKKQTGYKAYEVPLKLHNNLVKAEDNKSAGGFAGQMSKNKEGDLDFRGMVAYGTGTYDAKNDYVRNISGNIAGMNPNDPKFGCYGTWHLNKDTKKYVAGTTIEDVLLAKKCVELVEESEDK